MSPLKGELANTQASVWATIKWDWAIAGLVYLYVLLLLYAWFLSLDANQPTARQAGRGAGTLSPWIMADTAPHQDACQHAACEYLGVHPVVGEMPPTQMLAGYEPPPLELLRTPPGYVFRPQLHGGVVYAQRREQNRSEFALPILFPEKPDPGATPPNPASLIVSSPGYVLPDKPALAEQPAAATPEPTRQMTFQPFHERFQILLEQAPPYAMDSGDTLAIRFPSGPETEQPAPSSAFEPVQVLAVQANPAGRSWRINLEVSQAQSPRLMAQLTRTAPAGPSWASRSFSTPVALEFRSKPRIGTGQPMRLPATAVLAQGAHSRVWLALDGLAIPVLVKELQRLDDSVLVTEVAGARGLPIAQEDWLAMGALARREAMRAASARIRRSDNQLLTATASVIARPDAALKPAAAVKVRHD